ncbi:MAG: hypothetical protein UW97_C0022G0005 [Parcubacteria group bacterium GW2011_GWA2_45_15]|nr:MAG: hypothetical protein UW97_C0022G0005 [Parcubacteria group bacterium GW2011_GWA2_45_15]
MIITSLFAFSGLSIILLLVAKRLEEKRKRIFFISNAISKGDTRIRGLYLKVVRLYSEGKERISFFYKKQIPIHSRNSLNKLLIFIRKRREQYAVSMRDAKLLKKSDGISEFFKNMSELEKGNGEIHDSVGRDSQDNKKEVD